MAVQPVANIRHLVAFILEIILLARCSQGLSRRDAFIGYSEKSDPEVVVLSTAPGEVSIVLDKDNAPRTTALVLLAGQIGRCTGCRFYRNEAAPEAGSFGPPYGLLQGSLDRLPAVPPLEGSRNITRGSVCMIAGTKEFFIAVVDHAEWSGSFTVWGQVSGYNMATTVAQLVGQPYHEVKHAQYGTLMRMMDKEQPFTISVKTSTYV